jgi:hypothetical protein
MDAMDGGYWRFGDTSYPEVGVTYFAGTFMRHPLALAAAKAALTHIKERGPSLQQELSARTAALTERLNVFFEACDAPMRAVSFSSLWRVRVDESQPFASLFYYALRERGLHVYEQFNCFLSEAHGDAEVDMIATRIQSAVGELIDAGILTERGTTSHASARRVSDSAPKEFPLTTGIADSTDLPVQVPMTEGQTEKWLPCQYGDDANIAFNEAFVLTLHGPLDELALERALAAVSLRHEAFALSFLPDGSGQRLNSRKALPLAISSTLSGRQLFQIGSNAQHRARDSTYARVSMTTQPSRHSGPVGRTAPRKTPLPGHRSSSASGGKQVGKVYPEKRFLRIHGQRLSMVK